MTKGDRIFFIENSKESGVLGGQFGMEFNRIAGGQCGLHPVFYSGGAVPSGMKAEQEADFESAQALAVYLGTPREGDSREDDYGLVELLPRALGRDIPCLVYVAHDYPIELLSGLAVLPRIVNGRDEFSDQLHKDLERLIQR